MTDPTANRTEIVKAAMRLAAERAWDKIGMAEIAEAAGVTLADMRRAFPSKGAILAAFVRMIDDEVLARAPRRRPGEAGRDALFEVIMSRFDALVPYKSSLKSIAASMPLEPALLRSQFASQAWMLHAAGAAADGPAGTARIAGLMSVYASVFRTWLSDEDPGLARTMAALDRRLRSGERSLSMLDDVCSGVRRVVGTLTGAVWQRPTTTPPPTSPPPAA